MQEMQDVVENLKVFPGRHTELPLGGGEEVLRKAGIRWDTCCTLLSSTAH